jgi:hypothetical protein
LKENLQDGEVIVLGDFSEIIHFIFRMLHKDFIPITSKPPFFPFSAMLKILRMSLNTYVL